MSERLSGVLMHVSSFPNKWGRGDFGPEAYKFVDWLDKTKQSLWQILPLVYPDETGSPYTSLSANAIFSGFVSPEKLYEQEYLRHEDWQYLMKSARDVKKESLYLAFNNWKNKKDKKDFDDFCKNHAYWLEDAALFMTLHDFFKNTWYDFPLALRDRYVDSLEKWQQEHVDEVLQFKFEQFILYSQWSELKTYANDKGIRIIGDIPIFISGDSSDVWAHRDLFKLDEKGYPLVWTGVPPDAFTTTGQLWAQPHYNWAKMKENNYEWWYQRMLVGTVHADIIRVDHFRGFCAAYEVEYGAETAEQGRWVDGPRADIFRILHNRIDGLNIIAEDLGIITPDVTALRHEFKYPGMKILQFAFNSGDENPFLPNNFDPNDKFVVYTGTHDNNTAKGWFEKATDHEKHLLSNYCQCDADTVAWALIDMSLRSNAAWAVTPLQDILGLDGSARMNLPGTRVGNWAWQLDEFDPSEELTETFKELTLKSDRAK
ncbi:MAG: 4-alpha-glucanotransferase [Candidatus Neomarinimicrobiota bacterium]